MRQIKLGLVLAFFLLIGVCDQIAHGDGGTIRLSRSDGAYRISVFSSPTPFRAGPVDISVFVQDPVTGEPVPEVKITVSFSPCARPEQVIYHVATSDAATNKLLKAAVFELSEPGCWVVDVAIRGEQGDGRVRFALEAGKRTSEWPAMWPWIVWPIPVILVFSVHQFLVRRRQQRKLQRD
jgi:hypothetical protein